MDKYNTGNGSDYTIDFSVSKGPIAKDRPRISVLVKQSVFVDTCILHKHALTKRLIYSAYIPLIYMKTPIILSCNSQSLSFIHLRCFINRPELVQLKSHVHTFCEEVITTIICALMVRAGLLSHTNTERLINTSETERRGYLKTSITVFPSIETERK